MNKFSTVIIAMLLTITFGCSKSPSELMVGQWEADREGKPVVEYFSDGTFSTDPNKGNSKYDLNGNWTVLDDGRLKLDFIAMGKKYSSLRIFQLKVIQ